MNLIVLQQEDLVTATRARVSGRRYRHLIAVLKAAVGKTFDVGMLNGRIGKGTVAAVDASHLDMDIQLDRHPPAAPAVTVVLALPRPKVLRRIIFSLTVLGIKRIILVNSARVEKSYWQTPFLEPEAVRNQLLLGLEQAGDTLLPQIMLRDRFKPFVEDELPGLAKGSVFLVADPHAEPFCPCSGDQSATLVIGPEGGFVPFEIELLASVGALPVRISHRILNVETAVPTAIAHIVGQCNC
ncbi:MAG: 16S rRNA (uracil(1498)-N(3))-methyltransferase [Nitrospiraceae bacterium]|nr:16S rRNA (uracil(1498)-N(3))-methyltransferase [Nitrospiraceae bacterium]